MRLDPRGRGRGRRGRRGSCRSSPSSSTTRASATPSPSTPRACPSSPTGSSRPCSRRARSPVGRPIGAPYITTDDDEPKDGAAVGVASLSAEGVWTRGAAAQVRETPTASTSRTARRSTVARRRRRREHERHRHRDRRRRRASTSSGPPRAASPTPSGTDAFIGRAGLRLRLRPAQGRPDRPAVGRGRRRRQPVGRLHRERSAARRCGSRRCDGERVARPRRVATIAPCAGCPPPQPDPHRRDLGRTDRRVGRHRRRRGHGLDARGRRVGRDRGRGRRERSGSRHGGRRRRQRAPHLLRRRRRRAARTPDGADGRSRRSPTRRPPSPRRPATSRPTTSIAVDDEGGIAAAWDDADGVVLATSDDGETFDADRDPRHDRRPHALGRGEPRRRERLPRLVRRRRARTCGSACRATSASSRSRRPSPHDRPGQIAAPPPTDGGGEVRRRRRDRCSTSWPAASPGTRAACVAPAGEAFTMNYRQPGRRHPAQLRPAHRGGGEPDRRDRASSPDRSQQTLDVDPLDAGDRTSTSATCTRRR